MSSIAGVFLELTMICGYAGLVSILPSNNRSLENEGGAQAEEGSSPRASKRRQKSRYCDNCKRQERRC